MNTSCMDPMLAHVPMEAVLRENAELKLTLKAYTQRARPNDRGLRRTKRPSV